MPYSIAIGSLQIITDTAEEPELCTCQDAHKACAPSFVFSIAGQVGFRAALDHLLTCQKRGCISFRKKVRESMYEKLKWLFREEVLLGCILIQPSLYGSRQPVNISKPANFLIVAHHLAHCPHESCARLRRSLLLKVRDDVSPNARLLMRKKIENRKKKLEKRN